MNSPKRDLLLLNLNWFAAAKQMPEVPEPNASQSCFYTGMQLEELGERIEAILGPAHVLSFLMKEEGKKFKARKYLPQVEDALKWRPKAMLDGNIDSLWVTVGAIRAEGSDLEGAYTEVNRANWQKRWDDGEFHHDENGKVVKPAGWSGPNLLPFIHPSLNGLNAQQEKDDHVPDTHLNRTDLPKDGNEA